MPILVKYLQVKVHAGLKVIKEISIVGKRQMCVIGSKGAAIALLRSDIIRNGILTETLTLEHVTRHLLLTVSWPFQTHLLISTRPGKGIAAAPRSGAGVCGGRGV